MSSTSETFGDRVRRLRLSRHLGQAELASLVGLSGNGHISKVENGRVAVDGPLARDLAGALECSVDYLSRPGMVGMATRPWLRAYADAPATTVEVLSADNITALESVRHLDLQMLPDVTPTFDGDARDDAAIEHFAEEVRAAAQIEEHAVVRNAMRAAERLGCVVLPMDSELGRHLGMSQRIDGVPVLRISRPSQDPNNSVPGDRQRFTTAHELGHVTLHGNCAPPADAREAQIIEKQAHRFAGAFLAPGDALVEDWRALGGRTTLTTLSHLKSTWGLAIKALVVRLRHLGVVDEDQARSLYKQISARGWNKREPVDVTTESAIWMGRAIKKKFGGDKPLEAASACEGLGVRYYQSWTDWSPRAVSGDANILSLPTSTVSGALLDEDDEESDAVLLPFARRR